MIKPKEFSMDSFSARPSKKIPLIRKVDFPFFRAVCMWIAWNIHLLKVPLEKLKNYRYRSFKGCYWCMLLECTPRVYKIYNEDQFNYEEPKELVQPKVLNQELRDYNKILC